LQQSVLGLDVGGANLKAAWLSGPALLQPFALWKQPEFLANALRGLLGAFPRADRLAVTMTGELCDCFPSKRHGVRYILSAIQRVAETNAIHIWQNSGGFVDLATACAVPLQVASANWLALATFAGRRAPLGAALLLDVGSTTCDIIPLLDGRPTPTGRTDPERLRCRELVYTGIQRTPVCALVGADGAAEFFATTEDVYVLLGDLPENETHRATADGQPMTRLHAERRLARVLCADLETSTREERLGLASLVAERQTRLLRDSVGTVLRRMSGPAAAVILSGSGEFLARKAVAGLSELAHCPILALSYELGTERSACACAYSVAVLAAEEFDGVR
jgi:probable H4MPT-linked C1 transfer pathway protein